MRISGIDEAGLGPRLGPFCAAQTDFLVLDDSDGPDRENQNLYTRLSGLITSELCGEKTSRNENRILVGDSKKLYSSGKGMDRIESVVLGFLSASGESEPDTVGDFIQTYCFPEDGANLECVPWYQDIKHTSLPMFGTGMSGTLVKTLKDGLRENGVEFCSPMLRVVPAPSFNAELSRAGGKGNALLSILTPLLRRAFRPEQSWQVHVDRLGGRRYYLDWLNRMSSRSFRVVTEEPKESVYEAPGGTVEFRVKGESKWMETALASMFAKYIREVMMKGFNRWWAARIPGIRPTAGYPVDADRFIKDVESFGAMPEERHQMVRQL